jgi:hypothetical protein
MGCDGLRSSVEFHGLYYSITPSFLFLFSFIFQLIAGLRGSCCVWSGVVWSALICILFLSSLSYSRLCPVFSSSKGAGGFLFCIATSRALQRACQHGRAWLSVVERLCAVSVPLRTYTYTYHT